jgi:hypothetical protein
MQAPGSNRVEAVKLCLDWKQDFRSRQRLASEEPPVFVRRFQLSNTQVQNCELPELELWI